MRHHRAPRIHLILAALACVATQTSCDKLTEAAPIASASPVPEPAKPAATAPAPAPVATPAAVAAPAPAAAPVAAAPTPAPAPAADVNALLDDKPTPTGVMASADLGAIDASAAPRLGGDATPHPSLAEAKWEPLPGGLLAAANPPDWKAQSNGNGELLIAADGKLGMVAITFTSKQDALTKLDHFGAAAKIKDVEWIERKTVRLGPDALGTIVLEGVATGNDGTKMDMLLAMIETDATDKLMVVMFADKDVPASDLAQAKAVMHSIRRVRA
jgi:hypothetical protein